MSRRVTHLFAELRSLLQGWRALRTIEFGKFRVRPDRTEEQIETRLLRGDRRVRRVLTTIESRH